MKKIKKLIKGQRKNIIKRNKKDGEVLQENKKGSALAETIILIAVSLVLAIALFYPQISQLLSDVMTRMNSWVNSTMAIM